LRFLGRLASLWGRYDGSITAALAMSASKVTPDIRLPTDQVRV